MAHRTRVLPAPLLPMAIRLLPLSIQSPAPSSRREGASMRRLHAGPWGPPPIANRAAPLAQVGQHLEVEGRERLAAWQPGRGEVTLDAPGLALGELAFGACGEEPGGRPALPILGRGSARSAKSCQCAWKLGRRSAVSIAGSFLDVDLTSGHGRAAERPSKLASAVSATGTCRVGLPGCRCGGPTAPRGRAARVRAVGDDPAAGARRAAGWRRDPRCRARVDEPAELGLAGFVVGQRQEGHHAPAGVFLWQRRRPPPPSPCSGPRGQLLTGLAG